jgi:hypothetical protein
MVTWVRSAELVAGRAKVGRRVAIGPRALERVECVRADVMRSVRRSVPRVRREPFELLEPIEDDPQLGRSFQ